jgi:predicted Zn-dependent protease
MKFRAIATLLLALFVVTACATSPTGRSQLMLVSEEEAITMSKQAYLQTMSELEAQGDLVKDPAVVDRIDTITGKLIAQAIEMYPKTADWEWSVEVIDEPETVNAWCMAGGRMAIYTGLLQQLDATDDEVAQVMGHEIAHALANHTAERMSVARAQAVGVGAAGILGSILLDVPAGGAMAATGTAVVATYALKLPNSRTSEAEADQIGIELAARAGYDPNAAVTLWQKMAEVGGDGPPEFMSTHPSPENRQQKLQAMVPEMMPYYQSSAPRPMYELRR